MVGVEGSRPTPPKCPDFECNEFEDVHKFTMVYLCFLPLFLFNSLYTSCVLLSNIDYIDLLHPNAV